MSVDDLGKLVNDLVGKYGASATVPGLMLGYSQFSDMGFVSGASNVNRIITMNETLSGMLEEVIEVLSREVDSTVDRLIRIIIITAVGITLLILLFFFIFARISCGAVIGSERVHEDAPGKRFYREDGAQGEGRAHDDRFRDKRIHRRLFIGHPRREEDFRGVRQIKRTRSQAPPSNRRRR